MKNILKSFNWLILLLLITSCGSIIPRQLKTNFSHCYDGKLTGIETLINIGGYFSEGHTHDKFGINMYPKHEIDTFYTNFMFFKDGIFAYNFDYYPHMNSKLYAEHLKEDKTIASRKFSGCYAWGVYTYSSDTIKVKYIHNPFPSTNIWLAKEDWYLVIDRNTIKFIDSKNLEKSNANEKLMYLQGVERSKKTSLLAKFVSINDTLDSNCWLKRKKWFWKNDSIKK